tara:strand:+ start:1059 stop:1376 length:318 start_codon:yes stop_codon:yes gene_type:complete
MKLTNIKINVILHPYSTRERMMPKPKLNYFVSYQYLYKYKGDFNQDTDSNVFEDVDFEVEDEDSFNKLNDLVRQYVIDAKGAENAHIVILNFSVIKRHTVPQPVN